MSAPPSLRSMPGMRFVDVPLTINNEDRVMLSVGFDRGTGVLMAKVPARMLRRYGESYLLPLALVAAKGSLHVEGTAIRSVLISGGSANGRGVTASATVRHTPNQL